MVRWRLTTDDTCALQRLQRHDTLSRLDGSPCWCGRCLQLKKRILWLSRIAAWSSECLAARRGAVVSQTDQLTDQQWLTARCLRPTCNVTHVVYNVTAGDQSLLLNVTTLHTDISSRCSLRDHWTIDTDIIVVTKTTAVERAMLLTVLVKRHVAQLMVVPTVSFLLSCMITDSSIRQRTNHSLILNL